MITISFKNKNAHLRLVRITLKIMLSVGLIFIIRFFYSFAYDFSMLSTANFWIINVVIKGLFFLFQTTILKEFLPFMEAQTNKRLTKIFERIFFVIFWITSELLSGFLLIEKRQNVLLKPILITSIFLFLETIGLLFLRKFIASEKMPIYFVFLFIVFSLPFIFIVLLIKLAPEALYI